MGSEWPIILSILKHKLENNGRNLFEGQVWLCSVSTSTRTYVTTSRLSLEFTMLGSKNMSFLWCQSLFNKNLSTKGPWKRCSPSGPCIARQEKQISRAAFSYWKRWTGPFVWQYVAVDWGERSCWFSFMHVNFRFVNFHSESEFPSSYCLQHSTMMLVLQWCMDQTFRVLQEALCEALCRFAHLWSESLQKGAKPQICCDSTCEMSIVTFR